MSAPETVVRNAIATLVDASDRLQNLAGMLEELGSLRFDAAPAEIRLAVTGMQAAATHALLAAACVLEVSGRLSAVAAVREG